MSKQIDSTEIVESENSNGGSKRTICLCLVLFLTAVVIESLFLFVVLPSRYRVNDNDNYWKFYKPIAESIIAGRGLVGTDGSIATTYPPGYPAVIATVFALADRIHVSREGMLDAFNISITSLSCLMIFLIARDTFGEKIAWLSWLLWVSYLPNLSTIIRPNSETPFILVLYFGIWVFLRAMRRNSKRGAFATGLTIGLASLIRPIDLFMPLVLGTAAFFHRAVAMRSRILITSLILAGYLISVAPWETYVMFRTGDLIPLSTNGPSGAVDGLLFVVAHDPGDGPLWVPADVKDLGERVNFQRNEMRTTRGIANFVLKEAQTHPMALAKLLLVKMYRPWYGTATKRHDWAILLLQLIYMPLGVAGLVLARRNHKEQAFEIRVFVSIIGDFWFMAFLVLPIFRYMVPPSALVMVFAAVAVDRITTRSSLRWEDARSSESDEVRTGKEVELEQMAL